MKGLILFSKPHRVVCTGLSLLIATGTTLGIAGAAMNSHNQFSLALAPETALAEPSSQAKLDAARDRLTDLGQKLQEQQDQLASQTSELESIDAEISDKEFKIEDKRQELETKKGLLGQEMRSNYKVGASTTMDYLLGSTTPTDFISRVLYLDKISKKQSDAITEVRQIADQLKQDLDVLSQKQSDQKTKVDELGQAVSTYQNQVAEAQRIFDSLDNEVKEQLAAEAQARAAAEAAAQNAEQQVHQGSTQDDALNTALQQAQKPQAPSQQNGGNSGASTNASNGGEQNAPSQNNGSNGGSNGAGNNPAQPPKKPSQEGQVPPGVTGLIARAYQQVGKPYVYGAAGPNAFDCSGLICYLYGWKHGHSALAMMRSAMNSGNWKTRIDQLAVGDLVFPYADGGHVGIYIGNGRYIHAANPGRGVVNDKIWSFYGGGPF